MNYSTYFPWIFVNQNVMKCVLVGSLYFNEVSEIITQWYRWKKKITLWIFGVFFRSRWLYGCFFFLLFFEWYIYIGFFFYFVRDCRCVRCVMHKCQFFKYGGDYAYKCMWAQAMGRTNNAHYAPRILLLPTNIRACTPKRSSLQAY